MKEQTGKSFITSSVSKVLKHSDIALAVAVMGIILVLLFPVPVFMLDFLLATSVTFSVMILMTALFIERPLDFSVFPTILLVSAMLRLALNIASTRLILSNGHTGTGAAGRVIDAFGHFVMENSIVIGIIVFGIITIINFVVITKGSGRIAEVAARFSLDAMPGKQMAIDADLSAGLIEETEAKQRRKDLEDESTFFGAMDGANKFVRGDAIAGILITFINFIGGIIIGMVQRDMDFSDALRTYTTLTIGDGLAAQVPALIVSLAAGLLVSKSGVKGSADKAIFSQLGRFPQAIGMSAAVMLLISFMPGIPATPFISMGTLLVITSFLIRSSLKSANNQVSEVDQAITKQKQEESEDAAISEALHIDSIKLELGYNLLSLINYQKGHKLTDQIKAIRKQLAKDLGFVIPSVRIHDNMQLPTNSYLIKIKNIECGRGEIMVDKYMIMDPKGEEIKIPGDKTTEPAFGLPALWIEEKYKEEASFKNYTIVDPPTIIMTHLTEVVKDNITELLSYSETQRLLDGIDKEYKKLVADVIPDKITIVGFQKILQLLLSESVSIRDLPLILEAVSEAATLTKSTITMNEFVRTRLARQISHENTSDDGYIPVIALSSDWERLFIDNIIDVGTEDKQLTMEPSKLNEFISAIKQKFEEQALKGNSPVLLVSPRIRSHIRSIVERFRPQTVVMSQSEIHPKAKIRTFGVI